ncbi:MAG: vWA domain-containing protein [Phycisphaerales bacterium]
MTAKSPALARLLSNAAPQRSAPFSVGSVGLEVAILFDTTGSMTPYLQQVRQDLARLASDLWCAVPGARLALIAYQDYCSLSAYVTRVHPFTVSVESVRSFLDQVEPTAGTDPAEAVEEALHQASVLPWSVGARRVAILVGDAPPHGVIDGWHRCRNGHTYLTEANALAAKGIVVYAVQCGSCAATQQSFREIARITGGKHISLGAIDDLVDLLAAISIQRAGLLPAFIGKLEATGRLSSSKQALLAQLRAGEAEQ